MECYDAAVWRNIPMRSSALLYRDGEFAAPLDAPKSLSLRRHRWITVEGNYRDCSAIDWEPGNICFTPDHLLRFVRGRYGLDMEAIVYCDRVDAHPAMAALRGWEGGRLLTYRGLHWWIGTLNGKPHTAEDLAAELAERWHAPIPAAQLWADQYLDDGQKDTSLLYQGF